MITIEWSIVIHRPIDEVFAFLSNLENAPKWESAAVEVKKTSAGPIGVGSTFHGVAQGLGRRMEAEEEFTEYELNRKFVEKVTSGPFPAETRYTFEQLEGGTRVNVTLEMEPGGLFKLARPFLVWIAKKAHNADLAKLRDQLEAGAV